MRFSMKSMLQVAGALALAGGAFWTTYSWGRPRLDPDAGCLLLREPERDVAIIVADIAQDLPLDHLLEVRREDLQAWSLYGYSTLEGDHYLIVLDAGLSRTEALSVLLHEYAHLVVWMDHGPDTLGDVEDHGPLWGEAYSRVYLAWLQ